MNLSSKKETKAAECQLRSLFGMHAGVSSGFHLRFLVMVMDTKVY